MEQVGAPDPYLPPDQPRPSLVLPGVAVLPLPRHTIGADLDRQVSLLLDTLEPGVTTAVLNVHTQTGVNLVVASKINERLTATMYIGKSGWDRPMKEGWEGAVSVRASWGGARPAQPKLGL